MFVTILKIQALFQFLKAGIILGYCAATAQDLNESVVYFMITVEKVECHSKKEVNRFINLPLRLYTNHPYWVPPLSIDARLYLNREKFPFYNHSTADFFIATRDGCDVGRIAVLEHRLFNQHHQTRQAQFYFFDCENDPDVAFALFEKACAWAKARNLDRIVGPKGFGLLDSFGILIEGFDQPQTMSFTAYNYEYYRELIEAAGFVKEVDFVSCRLDMESFQLPNWLHKLAERVQKKESLTVKGFSNLNHLIASAREMLQTYNQSFTNNWEYYPLPDEEIDLIIKDLKPVAVPKLMKVIKHNQNIVGLLFGLPDLSHALQHSKGHLTPLSILRLLREKQRLKSVVLGAVAILDEYRLLGGNALLITEIEKTIKTLGINRLELVNMAETAVEIQRDLNGLGIKPHKAHRVYTKSL